MANGKYHYAYNIVISCFLVQMIMLFGLQGIPLMLSDISKDLQLTATEAGSLTAAFSAFYGFLGFLWGFISDKIGARKVLIISMVLVIIGFLLFGLLGTSFMACVVTYAIVGIGLAATTVATIPRLMSRWFTTKKRHRPSSICMMGGVFCGMLQGIVMPQLVGAFGWHTALYCLAGITVVFTIVIVLLVRDEPKDKGLLPCGVDEADAKQAADAIKLADEKAQESRGLKNFITVLKMGVTWKLIIHTIFYQMAYVAVNSFLPMAIMSAGYTRADAGLVVTVYNLFQLIAMFVWGSIADKIEPRKALSFSLFLWTVGCVIMIFSYTQMTTAFVAIAITGLGLGAPGLMMSIFADYYPREVTGTGAGVSSTIGTVGRTVGPIIVGAIVDAATGNYMYVFVFAAISMVIASFIPFTFGNVRDKDESVVKEAETTPTK